jgi:hypothetical protein
VLVNLNDDLMSIKHCFNNIFKFTFRNCRNIIITKASISPKSVQMSTMEVDDEAKVLLVPPPLKKRHPDESGESTSSGVGVDKTVDVDVGVDKTVVDVDVGVATEAREGKAIIRCDPKRNIFYNPTQEVNRDIRCVVFFGNS